MQLRCLNHLELLMYASGPFTRLIFAYGDYGDLQIFVPRRHPLGSPGDLVNTLHSELRAQVYRIF
jgi:hypothetical protein